MSILPFNDRLASLKILRDAGAMPYDRLLTPLETKIALLLYAAWQEGVTSAYRNREGGISHTGRGELTHDDIYERMRMVNGHKNSSGSIRRRVSELAGGNYRKVIQKNPVINARTLYNHKGSLVNVFSIMRPKAFSQLEMF